MNWSDFMIQNIVCKKFDVTDANRNSNPLKIYPEDEIATEDVAMYRYFETVIGGTVNLYVNIKVSLNSSATTRLRHTISVYDKDDNVVAEAVINTIGYDSESTTLEIPVSALNKYKISTICDNSRYQDDITITDMVLFGKIIDNPDWYIF